MSAQYFLSFNRLTFVSDQDAMTMPLNRTAKNSNEILNDNAIKQNGRKTQMKFSKQLLFNAYNSPTYSLCALTVE